MALTKGVGFNNVRSFVIDLYGPQGWTETLALFERSDRDVLESVLAMGWYDLALYARLLRAIDRRFGDGDLRLTHQIGRYEAEKDLTSIHQWLLRLVRPSIAIEQMGKYWRRFHDTGDWVVERRSEREIVARLSGWGVVDAALCRELVGYLQRTLELLGAREVMVDQIRCRARGEPDAALHDCCEFRARYRIRQDRDEPGVSTRTGLDRSFFLEVLRGPSSSVPPPSQEGASGVESRPPYSSLEQGKADRTSLPGPGRFRSSRPPPSSSSQEAPRSERWGGPPASTPPSASRPSTIPAPPSVSGAGPTSRPPPPMPRPSQPPSTSKPPSTKRRSRG